MAIITRRECANLLAAWLKKNATGDSVEQLAKHIGYNLSPLFGAKGKRVWFFGEVVMANVALAIYAVNQTFGPDDSKAIIDSFLASTRESSFILLEERDSQFKARYSQRMAEYFKILHESQPALGFSFAFMRNCDLDPLKNLGGQLQVAAHFGSLLKETLDLVHKCALKPDTDRANSELLVAARAAGNTRDEIVLSVVAVADEALKMEESLNRIFTLYQDGLEELLTDACLYFPVDLAVELEDLQKCFDEISEGVETASSYSTSLVKRMASQVQKREGE